MDRQWYDARQSEFGSMPRWGRPDGLAAAADRRLLRQCRSAMAHRDLDLGGQHSEPGDIGVPVLRQFQWRDKRRQSDRGGSVCPWTGGAEMARGAQHRSDAHLCGTAEMHGPGWWRHRKWYSHSTFDLQWQ